jgi:hypothetical protein
MASKNLVAESHEMAVIGNRIGLGASYRRPNGGEIMKRLTRAQLFVSAKKARRNKDWFERAKLVVAAARDRAVETAQATCNAATEALSYRATETPLG